MLALHRALTADGWQPFDEVSGLPVALERAEEDARRPVGSRRTAAHFAGAGYRSDDGRFYLDLGFRNFDVYTGLPASELGDGEYGMMVSVSHQSYLA